VDLDVLSDRTRPPFASWRRPDRAPSGATDIDTDRLVSAVPGPARWALGRLWRLALLLVAVTIGCFALVEASPIDPVDAYVGADMARIGPDQRDLIAERWGLDDPAPIRFGRLVGQLARGNLGTSMIYDQPVATVIAERFTASLVLMTVAWLASGAIGFGLGIVAAATRDSVLDRTVRWWAYTLASAPTFWIGLLLLAVFSVSLGWTPLCCAVPIGADPAETGLVTRAHHLLLPAVTLSIVGVAPIVLHTRERATAALSSDFVVFARAQGDRGVGLIRHRVLRSAAVPAVLLLFASVSELFGGAILAETVFSYPGLGQATTEAGIRGDVPLLVGIALFSAVFVFVGNTLGDLIQGVLDPRVPPASTIGRRSTGGQRRTIAAEDPTGVTDGALVPSSGGGA
jgi:peptide/nickel transport system permease protein